MESRYVRLKALDRLAAGLSAAVTVFFFWFAYGGADGRALLYIQNESQSLVYPLSGDLDIPVSGPLGVTRIVIRGGAAAVTDSPCRDKLCVSMGHISGRGGWIACLPNRVFLKVDQDSPAGDADAAAY
ncbi:MAG: NusG domain II-containing protein [Spirochaetales bacterium]|jgi:hypothetical protein|nr:NusG domain II-containing protein [Spirochaetales bacterium]